MPLLPQSASRTGRSNRTTDLNSKSTIMMHAHGGYHRDNNMRAAIIHVMADAGVSVLVIVGLLLARAFGWLWMDPLAGLIGALVIANWSVATDARYRRHPARPNAGSAAWPRKSVQAIESDGDQVTDLHLWRLAPAISAPSSRSRPSARAKRRITGRDWRNSPACPT